MSTPTYRSDTIVTVSGRAPWDDGQLITNQQVYFRDLPTDQALWVQCKAVHEFVRQILIRDGVPLRPGEHMTVSFDISVRESEWSRERWEGR